MRTIFTGQEVVRLWAKQNPEQRQASTRNKSVWFGDYGYGTDVLRSYGTPIARFYPDFGVTLVSAETYSVTTSKYIQMARLESPYPVMAVRRPETMKHSENYFGLACRVLYVREKLRKARTPSGSEKWFLALLEAAGNIANFGRMTGMPQVGSYETLNDEELASLQSRSESLHVEYHVLVDEWRQASARSTAERAAAISEWREGKRDTLGRRWRDEPVLLRLLPLGSPYGEEGYVETSTGYLVSVWVAKNVIRKALDVRKSRVPYSHQRGYDDEGFDRIADYSPAGIDANGDVTVGCTTVLWDEVRAMGILLGVFNEGDV